MEFRETKDVFLLTGAGFTKNFGGFLATEMWAQIFNDSRIQAHSKLRELLQNNFDFEGVYSQVIKNNKTSDDEKEAMQNAVQNAYAFLDDAIRHWKFNSDSPYPVNIYGWQDFLNRIWPGPYTRPAIWFTLNQDLFVERRWGHPTLGVPRFSQNIHNLREQSLEEGSLTVLPQGDPEKLVKEGLSSHNGIHYVKLHGSYGWRASNGSRHLVIGTNKEDLIKQEPILRGYFELLKSVIGEKNKKVLIIGYSFRDMHVNNILLKGVQDDGLKIYILNTQPPEELKYQIEHGHFYAKDILNGLSGYFPYALKEVFPGNQERTIHFNQIASALRG